MAPLFSSSVHSQCMPPPRMAYSVHRPSITAHRTHMGLASNRTSHSAAAPSSWSLNGPGTALRLPALPIARRRPLAFAAAAGGGHSTVQTPPPLQITRSNFTAALPAVKQAMQQAQFVAFDCEMTGLFLQGAEDYIVDDVDDRYMKTAAAAEQFLVTQFGLSCFSWTGAGYEARSFNFHLFPSPHEDVDMRFMSQASSLAFLASQGFDFNKMIYEGVSFIPLSWRDKQFKAAAAATKTSAAPPSLDDLDEDESCLLTHLEQTISNWLKAAPAAAPAAAAAAAAGEDGGTDADTLYLPAPPPQLLKLQRRLLEAGIGSSRWRRGSSSSSSKKSGSSTPGSTSSSSSSSPDRLYIVQQPALQGTHVGCSNGSGVMLRRATAAQVAAEQASHRAHRAEEVLAATGFSQVFELLRDARKPVVGHNIRFDLAYSLAAFVQAPLPKTWSGFKALVGSWFPGGVYDTKYLAHCLSSGMTGVLMPDSSLGTLYSCMAPQANPAEPLPIGSSSSGSGSSSNTASNLSNWLAEQTLNLDQPSAWQTLPPIQHAPGCEAYAAAAAAPPGSSSSPYSSSPYSSSSSSGSLAHEAGYDAFMTGVVFVGMLRLFELDSLSQRSRWQLPVSPAEPPGTDAVQQYGWRQYHAKSKDIPYAALQGPEVVPQRPEIVYLTGFQPGTTWQYIQRRFAQLGLGKPPVSFVRSNGLASAVTGAYIIMPSSKQATKAVQLVRQEKSWKVQAMSYSDFFYSKHGRAGAAAATGSSGADGSSSSSTAAVRPRPVAVQTAAAAAEGREAAAAAAAGSSASAAVLLEAARQLQSKTVQALEQRRMQQEQHHQREAQEVEEAETSSSSSSSDSDSSTQEAAAAREQLAVATSSSSSSGSNNDSISTGHTQHASAQQATAISSNGGSSSSSSSTAAAAEPDRLTALAERQRRLDMLQKQAAAAAAARQAAGDGASRLKRPPVPRSLQ